MKTVAILSLCSLPILTPYGSAEEGTPTTETLAMAAQFYLFYSPNVTTKGSVTIHLTEMPHFLAPVDQERAYDKLIIWWPKQSLSEEERGKCIEAFHDILGDVKSVKSVEERKRSEVVYALVRSLIVLDERRYPSRTNPGEDRVSQNLSLNMRLLKRLEELFPDRPPPLGIHIHHIRVGHAQFRIPGK